MSKINTQFLKALAGMFNQGDLAGVAEQFIFPLPFYSNDRLFVFKTPETYVEALDLYRGGVSAGALAKIVPRVVAEGMPVRHYSNVWVEWDHLDTAGHLFLTSQVHYIFHRHSDADFPKVELIEYKVGEFPDVLDRLSGMATVQKTDGRVC
ncbi:MAG: hypothetical protein ABJR46_17200 [Tateyamaria sp.]|uniref:hypothetical protein n=1 Tax=Tateyamaria sp. TaxID=1929288 RepID=UPI00329FD2CB